MKEQWKDIYGFEGIYQISNCGNVKNVKRNKNIALTYCKRTGYIYANLYNNYKRKNATVHRLIATAFIPNPNNFPEINHIDGNKTNNSIENLEWCTRSHNMKHAVANGLHMKVIPHDLRKTVVAMNADGSLIGTYNGLKAAADEFGISTQAISSYCKGNRKNKHGYKFEYQKEG